MGSQIHVVVNPAAGQPEPVLHALNQVFQGAGAEWTVSVTHEPGDATRQTREAVERGARVVAAYGGDGTVMEVANGLLGSDVPLAILPGGTGNVLSIELGIPQELERAAGLACREGAEVRRVDVGQCGERYFLLRLGVGFSAEQINLTSRELRDRYGRLAYFIAGLQALPQAEAVRYRFTLDGQEVEVEGATCLVSNAGSIGVPGLALMPDIQIDDGLLDVVVLEAVNLQALPSLAASVAGLSLDLEGLHHWQAREIVVDSDPAQSVVVDGEPWGETPCPVKVLPGAVAVLAPPPGNDQPEATGKDEHG